MGSYSGTCHLSSMAISENEDVLLIPVSYGSVVETSTILYGAHHACHPLFLPMIGKYNGFGSIKNIINERDVDHFRGMINHKFFNQEKFLDPNKKFMRATYAVFKNEYNSEQCLQFLSDSDIKDNINNQTNIHKRTSFENNNEILEVLTRNQLCYVDHNVHRIGQILIKKSFFNAMIKNHYQPRKEKIESLLYDFLYNPLPDDELVDDRFMHDPILNHEFFKSNILQLFNNDSVDYELYNTLALCRQTFQTGDDSMKDGIRNSEKVSEFVDSLVNLALILHIYADIGKTFYPNSKPIKNMSCLNDFAKTLEEELQNVKSLNISNFKDNNGDECDVPSMEFWQTPQIDD